MNELIFSKANHDPSLLLFQKDLTELITSIILDHETTFFNIISIYFNLNILSSPSSTIIYMIKEITINFFNKLFLDIQNKNETSITILIIKLSKKMNYEPYILLNRLIHIILDLHLQISREKLIINNLNLYLKSVLDQINIYLLSCPLLELFLKKSNHNIPLPNSIVPFDIVIE